MVAPSDLLIEVSTVGIVKQTSGGVLFYQSHFCLKSNDEVKRLPRLMWMSLHEPGAPIVNDTAPNSVFVVLPTGRDQIIFLQFVESRRLRYKCQMFADLPLFHRSRIGFGPRVA